MVRRRVASGGTADTGAVAELILAIDVLDVPLTNSQSIRRQLGLLHRRQLLVEGVRLGFRCGDVGGARPEDQDAA